jgi:hypothetical protein
MGEGVKEKGLEKRRKNSKKYIHIKTNKSKKQKARRTPRCNFESRSE